MFVLSEVAFEEPGEGAAIVFLLLLKVFFFSFLSIRGPKIIESPGTGCPYIFRTLVENHVRDDISFRASVPEFTIVCNTPMLEIESLVALVAGVKLCLKLDTSNLVIYSTAVFMCVPAPDLEKFCPDRNVLERLVPFRSVFCVFETRPFANVVQLVRDLHFVIRDLRTIRVSAARVADSCSKGAF